MAEAIENARGNKVQPAHWGMVVLLSLMCGAVSSSVTRTWTFSLGTALASILYAKLYLPARLDEIFYRTTILTGAMTVGYLLFRLTERFHI